MPKLVSFIKFSHLPPNFHFVFPRFIRGLTLIELRWLFIVHCRHFEMKLFNHALLPFCYGNKTYKQHLLCPPSSSHDRLRSYRRLSLYQYVHVDCHKRQFNELSCVPTITHFYSSKLPCKNSLVLTLTSHVLPYVLDARTM